MDLSALSTKKKSNEGAFLHLVHPKTRELMYDGGDETKPVGLIMLGVDSDVVQQAKHARINAQISSKKPKAKPADKENFSEQSEADQNQMLADCTKGWKNLSLDGDDQFSAEKMLAIYSDPGWAWLRAQAIVFVDDRGNFIE